MLENFDPNSIEDQTVRQVVLSLMNLVENLYAKVQEQAEEIQRLRDENNRLKGEQGKPNIKANKPAPDLYHLKLSWKEKMRQDRNTTFESVAIRECPIDGIDRKKGRLGLTRRFR